MINTIKFDVFTGHYTDSINKAIPGCAFGVSVEKDGKKKLMSTYYPEDTYMTAWLKGVIRFFANLNKMIDTGIFTGDALFVNVYMFHKNVTPIAKKIGKVYWDLRSYVSEVEHMIGIKMRKANKSLYAYHDLLVQLVTLLLEINTKVDLNVRFDALQPTNSNMRTAQQEAEDCLNKQSHIVGTNVIQLHQTPGNTA